jgi:hypothetical protein
MLQQLRHADTSGREVKGLGSLCRLELRMLATILEEPVHAGLAEQVVLTSPDGSIASYPIGSILG